MKCFPVWTIIAFELVVIALLSVLLIAGNDSPHAAELARIDFEFSASAELIAFYEPAPNTYATNIEPDWLQEKVEYKINADTLRDSEDHEILKSEDIFRIAVLGDSFTYGLFIRENETYPHMLETMLNDQCPASYTYEVLNFGVPGYDVRYAGERFALRAAKYDPDLVIWLMKRDDILEVTEYTSNNLRDKVLSFGQLLELHGRLDADEIAKYQARGFARVREKFSGPLVIYVPQRFFTNRALLSPANFMKLSSDLLRSEPGGTILGKRIVQILRFLHSPSRKYESLFQEFVSNDQDIRVHKSERRLTSSDFFPDEHPRASGTMKYAEDLFDYLLSNELVPCDTKNAPMAR